MKKSIKFYLNLKFLKKETKPLKTQSDPIKPTGVGFFF